jgi:hypothetical protein
LSGKTCKFVMFISYAMRKMMFSNHGIS